MKIIDAVIVVSLSAVVWALLDRAAQRQTVPTQPVAGEVVQTVRAVRFMDGMPNATQLSTAQGELLIERFVEIPLNTQVVVRQHRNERWLCRAPADPLQDPRTLACWMLLSRPMEVKP